MDYLQAIIIKAKINNFDVCENEGVSPHILSSPLTTFYNIIFNIV